MGAGLKLGKMNVIEITIKGISLLALIIAGVSIVLMLGKEINMVLLVLAIITTCGFICSEYDTIQIMNGSRFVKTKVDSISETDGDNNYTIHFSYTGNGNSELRSLKYKGDMPKDAIQCIGMYYDRLRNKLWSPGDYIGYTSLTYLFNLIVTSMAIEFWVLIARLSVWKFSDIDNKSTFCDLIWMIGVLLIGIWAIYWALFQSNPSYRRLNVTGELKGCREVEKLDYDKKKYKVYNYIYNYDIDGYEYEYSKGYLHPVSKEKLPQEIKLLVTEDGEEYNFTGVRCVGWNVGIVLGVIGLMMSILTIFYTIFYMDSMG